MKKYSQEILVAILCVHIKEYILFLALTLYIIPKTSGGLNDSSVSSPLMLTNNLELPKDWFNGFINKD